MDLQTSIWIPTLPSSSQMEGVVVEHSTFLGNSIRIPALRAIRWLERPVSYHTFLTLHCSES